MFRSVFIANAMSYMNIFLFFRMNSLKWILLKREVKVEHASVVANEQRFAKGRVLPGDGALVIPKIVDGATIIFSTFGSRYSIYFFTFH